MKKVLSFLLVISLLLGVLATLSSCNIIHPITTLKNKMKSEGYSMTIELSNSSGDFLGSRTIESDGNVKHIEDYGYSYSWFDDSDAGESERYIEVLGSALYEYKKSSNKWTKRYIEDTTSFGVSGDTVHFPGELLKELFDARNYTQVKGAENVYKQKDDVVFLFVDDVTISISEYGGYGFGYACTLTMTADIRGSEVDIEIRVEDLGGSIELELPNV